MAPLQFSMTLTSDKKKNTPKGVLFSESYFSWIIISKLYQF